MASSGDFSEYELYELKTKAAEFYNINQIPKNIEDILNEIFYENPPDVYGRLSTFFDGLSLPPSISNVTISSTLDVTGKEALMCKMMCQYKNTEQRLAEFYLGLFPEIEVLPTPAEGEDEVTTSTILTKASEFAKEISEKLKSFNPVNQKQVDDILRKWIDDKEDSSRPEEPEKEDDNTLPVTPTPSSGKKKKTSAKKGKGSEKVVISKQPFEFRQQGCSIVSAASIAIARAASTYRKVPLFQQIHESMNDGEEKESLKMPVCALTMFGGGCQAPGKLNLAKRVFVSVKPGSKYAENLKLMMQLYQQLGKSASIKSTACTTGDYGGYQLSCDKIEQLLDLIHEAATALDISFDNDLVIGIQCDADQFFDHDKAKYEISTGLLKSSEEMIDFYKDILSRYSIVKMLVNPLRREDQEPYNKLCETVSERCLIVGGQSVFGSLHDFTEAQLQSRVVTGVMATCGGRVTTSDLHTATNFSHNSDKLMLLSHYAPDVFDDAITDIAVGLEVDMLILGAPTRGENISRIKRLLTIEEYLTQSQMDTSYAKLRFPVIKAPEPVPGEESKESTSSNTPQKSKKK